MQNIVEKSNRFIRQADLVQSIIFNTPVCVVGTGGIGSFTVMALTKMGFSNVRVWDYDVIDEENLNNQFYRTQDIGRTKTDALTDIVNQFNDVTLFTHSIFDESAQVSGLVISAVDSMAVRKVIWKKCKRNPDVVAFVDGRMGGQQAEIYSLRLDDKERKAIYEETLWSDAQAQNTRCTAKAVMYNVLWISSMIANSARLMLEGKEYKTIQIMDFENQMYLTPDRR